MINWLCNRLLLFVFLWSGISFAQYGNDYPQSSNNIEGFPEGCYYSSVRKALTDHRLVVGRIEWVSGRYVLIYGHRGLYSSKQRAEIADNVGLFGQEPYETYSGWLKHRTPLGSYVVAQVMDRSYLGLSPIVTCLSRIYKARYQDDRFIFGDDYWRRYYSADRERYSENKRRKWQRWKMAQKRRRRSIGDRRIRRDRSSVIGPVRGLRPTRVTKTSDDDDDDGRRVIRRGRVRIIDRDDDDDDGRRVIRRGRVRIIDRDDDKDTSRTIRSGRRRSVDQDDDDAQKRPRIGRRGPGKKRMVPVALVDRKKPKKKAGRGASGSRQLCATIGLASGKKTICKGPGSLKRWRSNLNRYRKRGISVRVIPIQ